MLQKLRNWLSPEARARRQRQAERKGLLAELSGISSMRLYGYSREAEILKRLRLLNHIDGRAPSTALSRQWEGRITRAGEFEEQRVPAGTHFIFSSGHKDAIPKCENNRRFMVIGGNPGVTIGPDGIDFGDGPNVLRVPADMAGRPLHVVPK